MSNQVMRWLRRLVIRLNRRFGLEVVVAKPPVLCLPTAEELIGDAMPSQIMKIWRETIERAGGDSNKEFGKMFQRPLYRQANGLGLPFADVMKLEKAHMMRQVKWFQDFVRRNETTSVLSVRPFPPLVPPVLPSLHQQGMTQFRNALDKALLTLPPELRVDATKWVMGELEKLEPKQ
jgi:hypothetical protein